MALKLHLIYYGTHGIEGSRRQIADRLATGLGKLSSAIQNQNVEFIDAKDFPNDALDTTYLLISMVSMGPGAHPSAQFNVGALVKFMVNEDDLGEGMPTGLSGLGGIDR